MYDVVIVGASFAGLAVANQLRGYRVLIVDQAPIGLGRPSACGTILQVLRYWDLVETVLQTHDRLILHTTGRVLELPSPYLWSTFDYDRFCRVLFQRSGADFIQARVEGCNRQYVKTDRGDLPAPCMVDASGCGATLASSLDSEFAGDSPMNCGLETIGPAPARGALDLSALHFWFDPPMVPSYGMAWVFPGGRCAGVGVGAYGARRRLGSSLKTFAHQIGTNGSGSHGSCMPFRLRPASMEHVLVVGDAAGMCLGLTGEGIRPALYFGEACGRTLRRVLDGRLTLSDGIRQYESFVRRRRRFFQCFSGAQAVFTALPSVWLDRVSRAARRDWIRTLAFRNYWNLTGEWGPPA